MGLFKKDSPAEKKLKELTGGFKVSKEYRNLLKERGIALKVGIDIQSQLKSEIKEGKLNEFTLESRFNQLINEKAIVKQVPNKKCPKCGKLQQEDYIFCINCGYEFNSEKPEDPQLECPHCNKSFSKFKNICPYCHGSRVFEKTCPVCNKKQNASNTQCIDCGHDFVKEVVESKMINCPNCNNLVAENTAVCPHCQYDFKTKIAPKKEEDVVKIVSENIDFARQTRFLNTFDFNLKSCPECDTKFLKSDPFCFNCGCNVLTHDTVKNGNLDIKDGKLVGKENQQSVDELSSLEALYNQTVQSKYAPAFKVGYVLYLEHVRTKPSKKFSDKIAKDYETTAYKLKKQAIDDGFIERGSPLLGASDFKVNDLKEILKQYGLKVSGKKDELIERLGENLSEDELKKHFKSKNYQISDSGREFLKRNSYILYVLNDKDISKVFSPVDFSKVFEEKEYSKKEIQDKIVTYLKDMLDKMMVRDEWGDFKIYSNAIAQVLEDKGELKEALNFRFKVFLFDLNNYSGFINEPEPARTRLKQKDMVKITGLLHCLLLPVDELKELVDVAYNEVLFKTVITSQDSLIYLLKVFGGENLDNISKEINEKYSNPY